MTQDSTHSHDHHDHHDHPAQVPSLMTRDALAEQVMAQYVRPMIEQICAYQATPGIEVEDINDRVFLSKPELIAEGEQQTALFLTLKPIHASATLLLYYELILDKEALPDKEVVFWIRTLRYSRDHDVLKQERVILNAAYQAEIQRQLKDIFSRPEVNDKWVSGMLHACILPVDRHSLDAAKALSELKGER